MATKGLVGFMKRNSATILTIVGSAGVAATAILAATETPKALRLIEEAKEKRGEELTKVEIVKAAASAYIPAVVTGASTIACVVGANSLNKRAQASLASAYALVSSTYSKYKDKVKELCGEETHEKVMSSIAAEKAKDPNIMAYTCCGAYSLDFKDAGEETRLFYDSFGDRYFESTISKVLQAEYHLNRNFMLEGVQDLNDFYDFLGLEPTDIGKSVGWSCCDDYYWIDFSHYKTELEDGLECYVIDMIFEPTPEALEF